MVLIRGGVFDGQPIDAFYMDRTEVTVAAYRECVQARERGDEGGCEDFDRVSCPGAPQWTRNFDMKGRDDHPMNGVLGRDAMTYCKWAGKRLPTDREWEWAARGREKANSYPWGGKDDPPTADRVNACGPECAVEVKRRTGEDLQPMYGDDDGYASTAPVGSKPAGKTPDGLLDMAGNVAEWTMPPQGIDQFVLQGGDWGAVVPASLRVSSGRPYARSHRSRSAAVGFRCARTAD